MLLGTVSTHIEPILACKQFQQQPVHHNQGANPCIFLLQALHAEMHSSHQIAADPNYDLLLMTVLL